MKIFDPKRVKCSASEWPRPIYHQVKVARGHLSGHPGRFSATVTLSWAPDTSWRISADTMTVVRSVLVILFGVFVATTAR